MTSKERLLNSLAHRDGPLPIDFGSTFITGIHCSCVEALRDHYGLERRPVKVCEPYQMLGEVEDDLKDAMGIDVTCILPHRTIFGFPNENWKLFKTWWGQELLVSEHFHTEEREDGTYIFPEGDRSARPSGHMPTSGYFFDTIVRQEPLDEDHLNPDDNLEEFGLMSDDEKEYWKTMADELRGNPRAVVTHLNGTGLGDIALVPAPFLPNPKGIRDIAEWYMATAVNQDYVTEVFARQTEIALENLRTLHELTGDVIDVVVVCGTDFGTQDASFCSTDTFDQLRVSALCVRARAGRPKPPFAPRPGRRIHAFVSVGRLSRVAYARGHSGEWRYGVAPMISERFACARPEVIHPFAKPNESAVAFRVAESPPATLALFSISSGCPRTVSESTQ